MDDEIHVPERTQGGVGVDIQGQPASLGKSGAEAGAADGFEKELQLAVDLGRPGKVPQVGQAERLQHGRRHVAGTVAESPIEEGKDALGPCLGQGLVPIADGRRQAQGFRPPAGVVAGTGAEDKQARGMKIAQKELLGGMRRRIPGVRIFT
jgi:hypothetical protein